MSDSVKDVALGCLGPLILALCVAFLWLTWPVWTILVATTGGWLLVRKRKNWWAKASASFLASTSVGLGAVCVLLFVLNAFERTIEPQWLRPLESTLVTLRIWLREKTQLTLPAFVLLVTGLVVMSYFLPQLKPVSRFFAVKSAISKVLVSLIAMTSFSFFSQVPLERFAVDEQKRLASEYRLMIERYRLVLRQEWSEVGRYLAAEYLEEATRNLSGADKTAYRQVFNEILQPLRTEATGLDVDYSGIGNPVANDLASRRYEAAMKSQAAETGIVDGWINRKLDAMTRTAIDIERKSITVEEWVRYKALPSAQERELAKQEKARERAKVQADEGVEALTKIFAEILGKGIPEIESLAGAYIKGLVTSFSEYVAGQAIRRSAGDPAKESPVDVANQAHEVLKVAHMPVILSAVAIGSQEFRQQDIDWARNEVRVAVAREVETKEQRQKSGGWPSEFGRRPSELGGRSSEFGRRQPELGGRSSESGGKRPEVVPKPHAPGRR